MYYWKEDLKVIKVEYLEKEIDNTTVLYFKARTIDEESLNDLDKVYGSLMHNLKRVIVAAGYDNSQEFFIELKNPEREKSSLME